MPFYVILIKIEGQKKNGYKPNDKITQLIGIKQVKTDLHDVSF